MGNIYLLSMLAGVVYVVFCLVDSKMNSQDKPLTDYSKTFIVGTLVTLLVLTAKENFSSQVGGSINKISENIFTGSPNF